MTMLKSRRLFLITLVLLGLLLSATVAIAGCGDTTTTTSATTAAKDTSVIIGDRALEVFASNAVAPDDYAANAISGANLAKKLSDPTAAAGIYLLDVRSKADFDKEHIQGASQVDFAQWAAPENLSKLPKDKKIVVICYTGNTAAQTVSGLRMLGFNAAALKAGMMGWTQTALTQPTIQALNAANGANVTTPANASSPAPVAQPFSPPSADDYTVLAEKANTVMGKMATSGDYANNTISAEELKTRLAGADKDKLFLLDVRGTADFNKGHIEGAVNVPFAAVAVPDNLKLLPKDKKIIVVCYTGNTAAQANTVLRMLDYDAAVLKFGMMGWSGNGKDGYITDIQNANNPVVTS